MKIDKRLAVLMLAGIVAAAFMAAAQADPGEQKIKIVCTAASIVIVDNNLGTIILPPVGCTPGSTFNGVPLAGGLNLITPSKNIKIESDSPGVIITLSLVDNATMDNHYEVKEISGILNAHVTDLAGDDHYNLDVNDLTYSDGPGDDHIDAKVAGTLIISDSNTGDQDKYNVHTMP